MDKTGNPGIYNMVLCPVCHGAGRIPKFPWGFGVCKECGGFGLLRKESQGEIQGVKTGRMSPNDTVTVSFAKGESHEKNPLRR